MNKEKNITSVQFWKRGTDSIEHIDTYSLEIKGKQYILTKNKTALPFDKEKTVSFINQLTEIIQHEDNFFAFHYENDSTRFEIKFFLEVKFDDFTYIAIKGINPFKQPHYKEILQLFASI